MLANCCCRPSNQFSCQLESVEMPLLTTDQVFAGQCKARGEARREQKELKEG